MGRPAAGLVGDADALVVLALRLPNLATGVLLGRVVDRWGGRRLILLDLTGRAVLLLLLVLSSRQRDTLVLLLLLLVPGGLCGAFAPASYAGVRSMVPGLSTPSSSDGPTP